ncbi:COP9 signalosome complex subunit 2-like protein [Syncephalis pseudoplumigaleata]|uniref:COP9 signalosome complex subunit 2 n=1 Tax=Syncephalis pseudoplumigaleata TaxID=1712513 RepID=A0A4P9YXA8_9FUNG|nr:COP9 signalosome complex subunit 2-like protein [Syncephalis pseudoplumigaleata]|eukprot:RKP23590.1 COP9 signalosome complex subunit 2-like protein [Syncephalis pseudoplumigaleata]
MSDEDFMLEDDEGYDFEYSSGEEDEAPDADLENKYYSAKSLKDEDRAEEAIREFRQVVKAEEEKGDWGFKALKQIVKLEIKLKAYDEALEDYRQLLTYTKSAVTRNYGEKGVNTILDAVSSMIDLACMERFYKVTLDALLEAKNERLWMKTNLKLAKLLLDRDENTQLNQVLRDLKQACQNRTSSDAQSRDTHLLEVYALEIQLLTREKKNKKLKELYQQCLAVKSAIPHPRIMGVIRECGGKMHMREQEWDKAQTDFFESFKNYDEAGSKQRIQVLRYLVLASMLTGSQINPFDSQETKPYKSDPQITVMTDLVDAYQHREIRTFEKILKQNHDDIMGDPFIREYMANVLRSIRMQVLLELIQPYTRIGIGFIAEQLNIAEHDVEELLVSLILDEKIDGQIDQVSRRLELKKIDHDGEKYTNMHKWADSLKELQSLVTNQYMTAH